MGVILFVALYIPRWSWVIFVMGNVWEDKMVVENLGWPLGISVNWVHKSWSPAWPLNCPELRVQQRRAGPWSLPRGAYLVRGDLWAFLILVWTPRPGHSKAGPCWTKERRVAFRHGLCGFAHHCGVRYGLQWANLCCKPQFPGSSCSWVFQSWGLLFIFREKSISC